MVSRSPGILDHAIQETPIAVLDFETTGLSPGQDRVVEVSVVRIDPGSQPKVVLDTLVNPCRRMAAAEIHGLTDRDVADAPKFEDVARELIRSLSGCVLAAHNVYFDLRFLQYELSRLDLFREIPHLCTMYMRPLLGLKACGLNESCLVDQIAHVPTHSSRSDSVAAAYLWMQYCRGFDERGIGTFRDLTKRGKKYKFFASFDHAVHGPTDEDMPRTLAPLKPRHHHEMALVG